VAQPTPYSRLKNFTQYATDHTSAPYNGSDHDVELDAIETTLDDLCTNLAIIQRDDGYLKNASVHADAFSTAALALIASDWTPRGAWLTATAYAVGDVVETSSVSYVCATVHTSGVFATDRAAGKWIVLGQAAGTAASGITASAYSHIAATNVQAFLEELTDEKARIAGSTSQTFDVADASDDTHAVAAGQIQKDSLCTATAGGTSDALTATIASGLTTLTDKMRVRVKASAANGTTGPTFDLTLGSTSTSAKTIKKGNAQALVIGDIAGAGHMLELVYTSSDDCWLLQNPAYPVGASTSAIDADSIRNIGISFSTGASALTASLKSATGGTPSASDAVQVAMRSSSASTGTYATRSVTSSLTFTAPSGATFGHSSAVAGRLHWYLIDNSGTLELAVSGKFHGHSGIVSTTAVSSGSTSATVMYSTSARSSVPFRWIATTTDTQATAGTWASNPTQIDGVLSPLPAVETLDEDASPDVAADYLGGYDTSASGPKKALYGTVLCLTDVASVGKNFSGVTNTAAQFTFTADNVVLFNASSQSMKVSSVSQVFDLTVSGAGGLDNGAEAANTWYYVWIIAKADGTKSGILSTSSSAPTMPSGYTYKALVGAVRNDGSSNLIGGYQRGRKFFYTQYQTVLSSGTATSETSITITSFVPPIASTFSVQGAVSSGSVSASGVDNLKLRVVSSSSNTALWFIQSISGGGQTNGGQVELPNVSQTLLYILTKNSTSTLTADVDIIGYSLPIGGQ